MKRIGIFYGSTTGATGDVARAIAAELGVDPSDVHNVASAAPTDVADYAVLLLGTSTWGDGDLQSDWEDFVHGLQALDLTGKQIGLFGLGDESMTDTFCNGVGRLYDDLAATGAQFVGAFGTDGYEFARSLAVRDGKAVGLLLDNANRPEATPERIDLWCTQIKNETAD